MRTQFNRLDFNPKQSDSHLIKIGRVKFLNFACDTNLTECVQSAKKEYKNNENDLTKYDILITFFINMPELVEITQENYFGNQ